MLPSLIIMFPSLITMLPSLITMLPSSLPYHHVTLQPPPNPQVPEETSEYSRYRENPKVASMSDVLPIKTRDSIKFITQDDEYVDYIQSCLTKRTRSKTNNKSNKGGRGLAGKTASEPNVLEVGSYLYWTLIYN